VELGTHPHIVRCYEVFRLDPEVYLVLELVAKELDRDDASLRSWLFPVCRCRLIRRCSLPYR